MLYPGGKHSRAVTLRTYMSMELYPPLLGEKVYAEPLGVSSSRVQMSSTRFFWSCDDGE